MKSVELYNPPDLIDKKISSTIYHTTRNKLWFNNKFWIDDNKLHLRQIFIIFFVLLTELKYEINKK